MNTLVNFQLIILSILPWVHLIKGISTPRPRCFDSTVPTMGLCWALYQCPHDQMTSLFVISKENIGNPVSKVAASSTPGHMVMVRNRSCLRYMQPQHRKAKSMFGTECCLKSGTTQIADEEEWGLSDRWNQLYLSCVDTFCRKSWLYPLCNGAAARALFRCSAQGVCQPNPWASFCHERYQSSVNCQELGSGQQERQAILYANTRTLPRWPRRGVRL